MSWDDSILEAKRMFEELKSSPGEPGPDGLTPLQRQLLKPKFRLALLESSGLIRSDDRWLLYESLGRFPYSTSNNSFVYKLATIVAPASVFTSVILNFFRATPPVCLLGGACTWTVLSTFVFLQQMVRTPCPVTAETSPE